MTKKATILKMFNDKEWQEHHDPKYKKVKYILREELSEINLHSTIEYGEKWTDIHYVQKILRAEGYKVLIGSWCIYVMK